jgi:hypothetical protein
MFGTPIAGQPHVRGEDPVVGRHHP